MTPLLLFLLGCATIYVGTVTAAFSTLMRLSLRVAAERSGQGSVLAVYLEDPLRLFIPARLLLTASPVLAAVLLARATGTDAARGMPLTLASTLLFVLVCEHLVPLALVRRGPERVLDLLLPSFHASTRVLAPLTSMLRRVGLSRRYQPPAPEANGGIAPTEGPPPGDVTEEPQQQEQQARDLLRSLVDFRETMVREVMTPRPDIVAISASASVGQLIALFREQQYSRMPVYNQTLDNIVGFVNVKDVILLPGQLLDEPITTLVRPASFVPETKRVPELLRDFQRQRVQSAIVVDEYGGLAGLVTIEDLLEEIVGEIRDEYDVEVEPVIGEADGVYVFSGKAHVEELAERLRVPIVGEGFETVGGYLLAHLGRVPNAGEKFEIADLSVEVLEAERRRITRVRIARRPSGAEGVSSDPAR